MQCQLNGFTPFACPKEAKHRDHGPVGTFNLCRTHHASLGAIVRGERNGSGAPSAKPQPCHICGRPLPVLS